MIDVLIIGSGGAGLSSALKAKDNGSNVLVVSKSLPTYSQTAQAQGGINAVLYEDNLIKRVGYIDGWNGIQEQLFNRLKQFL